MNTIFLVATLMILLSHAQGQGTYPLQVGDLWQYWEVPGQHWTIRVTGDTLMIDGNIYMVLTGPGGGFLRQSGPQVFGFNPVNNTGVLLYDFSKTIGDTVVIRYYGSDTIIVTVESDEMRALFGRMLRTWVFHERHLSSTYYALRTVADRLGLVVVNGEVFGYGLQGAIINGIQYGTIVNVSSVDAAAPTGFSLLQNYPNPFNPSTTIKFQIPRQTDGGQANTSFVTLKVFDLLGRDVATLVKEEMRPGSYERTFDGSGLASGVYLYRLQVAGFTQTRKLLLMK